MNLNLQERGWKKRFIMQFCRPENWNTDFSATAIFSTTK